MSSPYPKRLPPVGERGLLAREPFAVSERRFKLDSHAPTYDGRRYYVHAHLWRSAEERDAATGTPPGRYLAWHQPAPFYAVEPDRWAAEGIGQPTGPKLGDVHFTAGQWSEETVAHEAFHVSLWNLRVLVRSGGPSVSDLIASSDDYAVGGNRPLSAFRHGSPEEEAAYAHGEFVRAVHSWLWRLDPDRAWTQTVVG